VNLDLLGALAQLWREEASVLRRRGASVQADVLEQVANELETRVEAWATQDLSVAEAAIESGYSEDHLRELVRKGRLPDTRPVGSEGRILIRRCDLPRKPCAQGEISGVVEQMTGLIG